MFKDCKTVLDPFVGSGTTAEACKILDLDFIGMDIDKNIFPITSKRLKKFHTSGARTSQKKTAFVLPG
jgi:site-specific DNA-methyltransferase (adenine-specific)